MVHSVIGKDDPILKDHPTLNIRRVHDLEIWFAILRSDCDRMAYLTDKQIIIKTEVEYETVLPG